jgi:hypothetical protein
MRHAKDGCGIWKPMLRHLKQIWIAEAMLQLCYHEGASMACALHRIAGKHRTDAASGERMLSAPSNDTLIFDV